LSAVIPIYDTIRSSRPAWVTKSLIVVNVLVYIFMANLAGNWVVFNTEPVERFILEYAFKPVSLITNPLDGAADILTSMFMHGGLEHIVGNMLFLWIFGDNIEDRLGHGRFLLFYLLAGVFAALTQAILGGFLGGNAASPMLGASGAIGGVLGGYLMLHPTSRIYTVIFPLFRFFVPAYVYLPYWVVVQFVMLSTGQPGIAIWAHIGGFVCGLIAVRLMGSTPVDFVTRNRW
jgi:membrane associated rhomboid family serine protease